MKTKNLLLLGLGAVAIYFVYDYMKKQKAAKFPPKEDTNKIGTKRNVDRELVVKPKPPVKRGLGSYGTPQVNCIKAPCS